jgi:hypothetical protein
VTHGINSILPLALDLACLMQHMWGIEAKRVHGGQVILIPRLLSLPALLAMEVGDG